MVRLDTPANSANVDIFGKHVLSLSAKVHRIVYTPFALKDKSVSSLFCTKTSMPRQSHFIGLDPPIDQAKWDEIFSVENLINPKFINK